MLFLLSYMVVKLATASFIVSLNVTCKLFVELCMVSVRYKLTQVISRDRLAVQGSSLTGATTSPFVH